MSVPVRTDVFKLTIGNWQLAIAFALLAIGGCGKDKPRDPASRPTTQHAMPDVVPGLKEAGLEEDLTGKTEVMVKSAYDRQEKETYKAEPEFLFGTLQGSCRFEKFQPEDFPPDPPVDFAAADAIKDPRPKELDFYKVIELTQPQWTIQQGTGKNALWQPYNVVLIAKNVEHGRRAPLTRPVMSIREGRIRPGDASNYGGGNVQFGPVHERAQFTTWDSFPSHIVLTHAATGKVVFEKDVAYAQEPVKPGQRLEYKPEIVTTEPLREPGLYVVTDARHPWLKWYLFVVDNPYVTVITLDYKKRANFEIAHIPPGKHTIQVWHPVYKPVEETIEVEVEPDKVKEILIKFRPPTERIAN